MDALTSVASRNLATESVAGEGVGKVVLAVPLLESVSAADGVVWTVDTSANLDGFDAANGQPLVHRPLSLDAGAPGTNDTSAGITIAEHGLFVAAGGLGYSSASGYVIAYRAR